MKFKITKINDYYVAEVIDLFYAGPRVVGFSYLSDNYRNRGVFNTIEQAEGACMKVAEAYRQAKKRGKWKKVVKY